MSTPGQNIIDDVDDDDDSLRRLRRQLPPTNRANLLSYIRTDIERWRAAEQTAVETRRFSESVEAACIYQIIVPLTEMICRLYFNAEEKKYCEDFPSLAVEWFRRYARNPTVIEDYVDDDDSSQSNSVRRTNALLAQPPETLALDAKPVAAAAACILLAAKEYLSSNYRNRVEDVLFLREEPLEKFHLPLKQLYDAEVQIIQIVRLRLPTTIDFYRSFRSLAMAYELTGERNPRFHRAAMLTAVLQQQQRFESALQAAAIVSLELEMVRGIMNALSFQAEIGPLLQDVAIGGEQLLNAQSALMADIGALSEDATNQSVFNYVRQWQAGRAIAYSKARA